MTYRWPVLDGDRVAVAPHTDLFMTGRRFGIVEAQSVNEENQRRYLVRFSPIGVGSLTRHLWLTADDLLGAIGRPGASPSTVPEPEWMADERARKSTDRD